MSVLSRHATQSATMMMMTMTTTTTTTRVATTSVSSRASAARNGTKVTLPTRVVRREVRARGTWTRRDVRDATDATTGGSGWVCAPSEFSGLERRLQKPRAIEGSFHFIQSVRLGGFRFLDVTTTTTTSVSTTTRTETDDERCVNYVRTRSSRGGELHQPGGV